MYGTKAGNLDFVNGVDSFVQTAKAHKNLQDDGQGPKLPGNDLDVYLEPLH